MTNKNKKSRRSQEVGISTKVSREKKLKITPLGSRVLVEPETAKEEDGKMTDSGIYIPQSGDKEKPERGMVIAVGLGEYDDGELVPMRVKPGDKVMFSRYGYDEVKIDGKEYFIIKEENILAVMK